MSKHRGRVELLASPSPQIKSALPPPTLPLHYVASYFGKKPVSPAAGVVPAPASLLQKEGRTSRKNRKRYFLLQTGGSTSYCTTGSRRYTVGCIGNGERFGQRLVEMFFRFYGPHREVVKTQHKTIHAWRHSSVIRVSRFEILLNSLN